MRRAIFVGLIFLWVGGAAAQASTPDQKVRLVEQKIKLLEMLLNSPAAKATGRGAEIPPLAEKGRRAIELARTAIGENRLDEAQRLVDEALKSSSAESRRLHSETSLAADAQRQSYQNLVEQVATYRAAVADLKDGKMADAVRSLLGRIDAQVGEARKLEGVGRLAEANRILSDAYKLAVGELSRLRAGQEVVMSLNFASPAEEYAYEQRRFESAELMVGMMLAEGRGAGDRQALVDGFTGQGRHLKAEAAGLAGSGRHKEAVGLMEKATGEMNRALQAMGVPVF